MKKTLSSGATLDITRSPFVISHKLFKAVISELKHVNLKLGLKEGQTLGNLINLDLSEEAIDTFKNALFTVLASDLIEESMWECMARATYNNQKIDRTFFDDEKHAEDYLEVAKEVVTFNLAPFYKSLSSLFPKLAAPKLTESQKST